MVEQLLHLLVNGGRPILDHEGGSSWGVSDCSSPQGQDAAHVPLVKMDHLARLLVAAADFLAPRYTLARKVLQHPKLQGLPLVAAG